MPYESKPGEPTMWELYCERCKRKDTRTCHVCHWKYPMTTERRPSHWLYAGSGCFGIEYHLPKCGMCGRGLDIVEEGEVSGGGLKGKKTVVLNCLGEDCGHTVVNVINE